MFIIIQLRRGTKFWMISDYLYYLFSWKWFLWNVIILSNSVVLKTKAHSFCVHKWRGRLVARNTTKVTQSLHWGGYQPDSRTRWHFKWFDVRNVIGLSSIVFVFTEPCKRRNATPGWQAIMSNNYTPGVNWNVLNFCSSFFFSVCLRCKKFASFTLPGSFGVANWVGWIWFLRWCAW